MDIIKLRRLFLKPCRNVIKLPYNIQNYREIIKLWTNYLNRGDLSRISLKDRSNIRNIFEFHKSSFDHILLYSCKNAIDRLLLGKINGEYINILIPNDKIVTENFLAVFS